jgi:hypothetical protein
MAIYKNNLIALVATLAMILMASTALAASPKGAKSLSKGAATHSAVRHHHTPLGGRRGHQQHDRFGRNVRTGR